MSQVSSEITSIREQIRLAIRLALVDLYDCTELDTSVEYSNYMREDEYPLCKAFFGEQTPPPQRLSSGVDVVQDSILVQIVPWCGDSDYELLTSQIVEGAWKYFSRDIVREYMADAYQTYLDLIEPQFSRITATRLTRPFAAVTFTLKVKYRIASN